MTTVNDLQTGYASQVQNYCNNANTSEEKALCAISSGVVTFANLLNDLINLPSTFIGQNRFKETAENYFEEPSAEDIAEMEAQYAEEQAALEECFTSTHDCPEYDEYVDYKVDEQIAQQEARYHGTATWNWGN